MTIKAKKLYFVYENRNRTILPQLRKCKNSKKTLKDQIEKQNYTTL